MNNQKEAYDEHPELWHYTTMSGLEGILRSGQLWATDYKCLNDTSEVQHLRSYIEPYFLTHMRKIYANECARNPALREKVINSGGMEELARHDMGVILDYLYRNTFAQLHGPFITSFCSHVSADEWTKQHGLLSQWRAYGDGGYAIVLDTEELTTLLTPEHEMYYYWLMLLGDVTYDDNMQNLVREWPIFFDGIQGAFDDIFLNRDPDNTPHLDNLHKPFVGATCTFKHRAFLEESEVRIVAYPLRKDEVPEQERTNTHAFKKVHFRNGDIPYIRLFRRYQERAITYQADRRRTPLPSKRFKGRCGQAGSKVRFSRGVFMDPVYRASASAEPVQNA